jgi:hypothetical protein
MACRATLAVATAIGDRQCAADLAPYTRAGYALHAPGHETAGEHGA